ncbi:aspartyl-phosphate phosphatase Spo0E family protein [Bacillus sp. V5-8f]|uniref:aspartyl-phosphate phosphatase Spo0E family protein n=1 Tax=Bacillus sp. V5-8f TaxID=2053044 RepID=UPI000C782DA8|nr:aspartyl-phosphate phosphatase Spo0E family protein [Bacillus sp. V5-8f]PLT33093.1 hypothetical protein CUU64_15005 [Bacillus sp. V5-8f]
MTSQLLTYMIQKRRAKMIDAGLKYGLSSPITVQRSQELDYLLNIQFNLRKYCS